VACPFAGEDKLSPTSIYNSFCKLFREKIKMLARWNIFLKEVTAFETSTVCASYDLPWG
jgi:hypothetical protein